jgi:uncharacterized membrane protein
MSPAGKKKAPGAGAIVALGVVFAATVAAHRFTATSYRHDWLGTADLVSLDASSPFSIPTATGGPATAEEWPELCTRFLFVAFFGGAGAVHFTTSMLFTYRELLGFLPGPLAVKDAMVYATGVYELAAAALLAFPQTAPLGGWVTIFVLLLVYPSNLYCLLPVAGKEARRKLQMSLTAAWLRAPVQLMLLDTAAWFVRGQSMPLVPIVAIAAAIFAVCIPLAALVAPASRSKKK